MKPLLPVYCNQTVIARLRELGAFETIDELLDGAIAISMQVDKKTNPAHIREWFDECARDIRTQSKDPKTILTHLNMHLFEVRKFIGNESDYYNPNNSAISSVLQTQRGAPISLAVIYAVTASKLGVKVSGLGLPGHFMVSAMFDGKPIYIDVHNQGRAVETKELRQRMLAQFGKELEWTDAFLQPVDYRHWLTRILQNLISAFGKLGDYRQVAAALEMEMVLWPDEPRLIRDLALVLARIGHPDAKKWLDHYLVRNPHDPHKEELYGLLRTLG